MKIDWSKWKLERATLVMLFHVLVFSVVVALMVVSIGEAM
jgi:hypothetical protein